MVKVDQVSMEASTKKVIDIKRFASPVKRAQQKTDGSRVKSATRPTPSPEKKRGVDLSKDPQRRQQEGATGATPSPSRIRQSRRERTTLEAALDRVQSKREAEQSISTSSSVVSDESSVMNALSEAKARYERMLIQKRRRKAKAIKMLRDKNTKSSTSSTTPRLSPTASGDSSDIFSLHSEFRVESVTASAAAVATPTTVTSKKPTKKRKAAKAKKRKELSIFREEAHSADNEQSVKVIQTGANFCATENLSSEDAAPAKSLATSIYRIVATKSVDSEATPSSLGAKLGQYESKLHVLEKYLRNSDNHAAAAANEEEDVLVVVKADDEDASLEAEDLEVVEEESDDDDEDEIADIEAMPTDDISYDEDTAARLLLEDDAKEARTEEQADSEATSSGKREGAEIFSIPDCANFCYWMFYGEEAPKAAEKSLPEEEQQLALEEELSPEELVEKLARRMAMDAVLPKKKVSRTRSLHSKPASEGDDEVVTIYNRVEASAFVSRDVRMERAARRAIAAEVLKQALLAGYSTINAKEEACPCKKCGNQFLLNEADAKECVVCPVLKSDLSRVTTQMMREDPQHQVKSDLEIKLRSLKKRAIAKETIAKKAVEEEAIALQSKREAEELRAKAQQAATDAEVELLWKTKELRRVREASRAASQKARESIDLALEDKAEARRMAKLNVRLAENAYTEADYQHIFAIKETSLSELKIFIADEAVRKAIEARNNAFADFQDMKRCTAKIHSELETKKVEKAYAVACASMLLSKKDTDIKTQQALREEAELKAVELANKLVLEKAEAELAIKKAQDNVKRAEIGIGDAEKVYLKAHMKRESIEKVANDVRSKANETASELEDTVNEFNYMIGEERNKLKSTIGKRRADAMELATWNEQARQIYEARDTVVVFEEKVVAEEEEKDLEEEEEEDDNATADSPDIEYIASVEIETVLVAEEEEEVDETLAKDSWSFFHEVCGLISNRWKYEEAFRQIQMDPLYPYLNSCFEVNCGSQTKSIMHKLEAGYKNMSATEIAADLQNKAEIARPQLIELCKDLAKSLKISKVGVGLVKELDAVIEKADKKYSGNVLQVTDFCRTFIVVNDIATLLAVFEMMNSMMADRICRIKFSSLKKDGQALPGGYRDCKINLLVQGHICEIQVHLQPFWSVSQVQGYEYYQKAVEYSIDRIKDPYRSIKSISEKVLTKVVGYGKDALAETTLDSLALDDDEQLLNYFALAGIYLRLKEFAKAEAILVRLAALRSRSPSMGPLHSETLYLKKNLETALRAQDLTEEADVVAEQLIDAEKLHKEEVDDATASLWEFLLTDDIHQDDSEIDEKEKKEILASKNQWIQSRDKLFKRLKGIKRADAALSLLNQQ